MGKSGLGLKERAISPLGSDRSALVEALALIESQGLRFEPEFDDLICLFNGNELVACGARSGYVLKMIAIATPYQGADVLGELVTKLVLSAMSAGHDTVFVFTSPQNTTSFEALNFRLLTTQDQVALLEYGPGLRNYIAKCAPKVVRGNNGAIVINGNPFTLGHKYLVECAAKRVDQLYLFVVREDRSIFPFEARLYMAQRATVDLKNVVVLDTSCYAVSSGTFPSYFLKRLDAAAESQMQIDLHLFAQHIAPAFCITNRFVGHEPSCETTAAYNMMMKKVFKTYAIEVVELPRIPAGGSPISATRVRDAFAKNDTETLKLLVPPTTIEFLQSPSTRAVAEQLRIKMGEV